MDSKVGQEAILLGTIAQTMPDPMFIIDEEGTYIEVLGGIELNLYDSVDYLKKKRALIERDKTTKKLKKALKEIKTLRGILPLCSHCKKIRDDKGYWEQVDVYIHQHTEANISHGICPECAKKHYPDFDIYE